MPGGSGPPEATGSGVVIDAGRGLILTNAHVVSDGDTFLQDGRWRDTELAGVDVPTDVALLRVDNTSLRQVEVADSDKSRIGDVVFAAGYPFGLEQSLSMGIVSGLGRSSGGSELTDLTDAAIDAGNSGGLCWIHRAASLVAIASIRNDRFSKLPSGSGLTGPRQDTRYLALSVGSCRICASENGSAPTRTP